MFRVWGLGFGGGGGGGGVWRLGSRDHGHAPKLRYFEASEQYYAHPGPKPFRVGGSTLQAMLLGGRGGNVIMANHGASNGRENGK